MSVYTSKTGLSSILKAYTSSQRDKAKNAVINKVRFDMPKRESLIDILKTFQENGDEFQLKNYIEYLRSGKLEDCEFHKIVYDATASVTQLNPISHGTLGEALLQMSWSDRPEAAKKMYSDFCVDMLVAHSSYLHDFMKNLICLWIPGEDEAEIWVNGTPNEKKQSDLQVAHKLLERILTVIPVSFNILLETIERKFPYFKKPAYVVAGYIHNLLWLLDYQPIFNECILNLLLEHLVLLDVNAPRSEIEDIESDDESDDEDELEEGNNQNQEEMFEMDDCEEFAKSSGMKHQVAHTLDVCLGKIYTFLATRNPYASSIPDVQKQQSIQFYKAFFPSFDRGILAKYNTHHVQFIMFYYCSFKHSIAEDFLRSLWEKIQNPNVPTVLRQAAVGYMASFLARANFISLTTLQYYLKELCNWAHNYIQNCDQYRSNSSLKANLIFYTICQAVFYMIAFRSRNLTASKKCLLFLESLHLSGLVTCHFNPLRVCLPAVATAFAGVTRTYQLAYCHSILERNARRKLATIYGNETETLEETLDTFFPFDPYLLKLSYKPLKPFYLQYQASEAEEHHTSPNTNRIHARKRGDSEMVDEADIDDFLIADKRQKLNEREAQFTYGLSPGFHT